MTAKVGVQQCGLQSWELDCLTTRTVYQKKVLESLHRFLIVEDENLDHFILESQNGQLPYRCPVPLSPKSPLPFLTSNFTSSSSRQTGGAYGVPCSSGQLINGACTNGDVSTSEMDQACDNSSQNSNSNKLISTLKRKFGGSFVKEVRSTMKPFVKELTEGDFLCLDNLQEQPVSMWSKETSSTESSNSLTTRRPAISPLTIPPSPQPDNPAPIRLSPWFTKALSVPLSRRFSQRVLRTLADGPKRLRRHVHLLDPEGRLAFSRRFLYSARDHLWSYEKHPGQN